ncbi:hypothetical protein C1E23_01155 [Pseudoalteromonas phenolica]|uniref:Uncharacterized protein n=1 Tax=Pseudoalteromonas phenolica TaxID=161398 RepID=A0A4Q7ISH7_9GAMM|nr:hypothetical protein [Pseudoalteromonas phenolica]RZQ54922.1 hypothetical protein C1E23_01155 [Pseudoalteromonas phenolica]
MTELENIGKLAATASELLNAIRGGEIANMKAEHTQTLEEFVTAYNAKINEFTQQKGEALNQFNQEKAEAFAAADSQLQSRRAAVDAVLGDLAGHVEHRIHYYDGILHTKVSLGLKADPSDETVSEWVRVPFPSDELGFLNYSLISKKTMIYLKRASSNDGGYPDYNVDQSNTKFQFIIANSAATSEQINQKVDSDGLSNRYFGSWSSIATSGEINCIHINGLHPYQCLWVRAVNVKAENSAYKGPYIPQNVEQYGGFPTFAVDKVINYARIAK